VDAFVWFCVLTQLIMLRLHIARLPNPRSKGDGDYEICQDFILDDWLRKKIAVSALDSVAAGEPLAACITDSSYPCAGIIHPCQQHPLHSWAGMKQTCCLQCLLCR
jgi:hypothetical protein